MNTTKAEAYAISAYEWETWRDDDDAQEWCYLDENDAFRVTLSLDKRRGLVKLLGESLTYSGDSVYYYDVMAGYPRAYSDQWHILDPAPFSLDEDGDRAERLADVFRIDDGGEVHIVGLIELPADFIATMRYHAEQDAEHEALAYEFVEYANENGLKVDDFESLDRNVSAFVARNTIGGMSYGFANVDPATVDAVEHFIDECFAYDLHGYRAA